MVGTIAVAIAKLNPSKIWPFLEKPRNLAARTEKINKLENFTKFLSSFQRPPTGDPVVQSLSEDIFCDPGLPGVSGINFKYL